MDNPFRSSFDFSKFEMPKFEMPKMPKMPSVELPNVELPKIDVDALTNAARDLAYISVGLAVLAFQKAQVGRTELVKAFNDQFSTSKASFEGIASKFEAQLSEFESRLTSIEAKIDTAVEGLEKRLPESAAALLNQAHEASRTARKQVRELLTPAAA